MSIAELTAPSDVLVEHEDQHGLESPGSSEANDGELLRRFVSDADDVAFAGLVARHAALVMGVCRRALGSEQDAEDAFQATFLVLARKAGTVRNSASLAAWLYKTAYRIAIQARAKRARRKEETLEVEAMTTTDTLANIASEHEQAILDEEFNRLPEKYRLPLFLCCIEGKSREEAAGQLGMSAGAVKGRLERGRQLLRHRLVLRGITFSAAIGVLVGWQQTVQAAPVVATSLIASTVQASVHFASGEAVMGFASQNAVSLANANMKVISMVVLKSVACVLIVVATLAGIASLLPVSDAMHFEDVTVVSESNEEPTSATITLVVGREIGETGEALDDAPLEPVAAGAKGKRCCKKKKATDAVAKNDQPGGPSPTLALPRKLGEPHSNKDTDTQLVSILRVKDEG